MPALRAIVKVLIYIFTTVPARLRYKRLQWWRPGRSVAFYRLLAPSAEQHRGALSDPQQRNEEETEIVVHPLKIGLVQSAGGASFRFLVQHLGFGLDTGNDKTHGQYDRLSAEQLWLQINFTFYKICSVSQHHEWTSPDAKLSQRTDFGPRCRRIQISNRRHTRVCQGCKSGSNTQIGTKDFFEIASSEAMRHDPL